MWRRGPCHTRVQRRDNDESGQHPEKLGEQVRHDSPCGLAPGVAALHTGVARAAPPHVLLIVVDDLGWMDLR